MQTDAEMLLRYARDRDEQAFAALVQRHLGMVYGAALRRTGGRSQLAEDIAQRVFVDLARKAAWLSGHPALTGWLHRSTRYAAIDVMRAEQQKEKLSQVLKTMSDDPISAPDDQVEWSGVRPVLDAALDQLGKTDREAVLLRYIEGLSHAEVGARLRVSESAARMRAERALGKLRGHLARRGVTSTASALGLMLSNHAFAALPSGLASNVTQTALAATPAAGGLITTILMSKLTMPTLGAVLVSGATALIWTATAGGSTADELAALRAENLRLSQAVTENDAGVTSATPPPRLPLTAASAVNETEPAGEVSPRGHRNEGLDTPLHGLLTFAWACDLADPVEIENVITFDPDVRVRAEEIRLTMPAKIRAEYGTAEAFYGLVLAVTCLEAPPPGRDLFKSFEMVEVSPGRAVAKKPNGKLDNREFQLTETGWKYVVPLVGVENMVKNLNSPMLERLVKR